MRYAAWRLRAAQPVTVLRSGPRTRVQPGRTGDARPMVKQKVDLLALRKDERAALLLVALRGDF